MHSPCRNGWRMTSQEQRREWNRRDAAKRRQRVIEYMRNYAPLVKRISQQITDLLSGVRVPHGVREE